MEATGIPTLVVTEQARVQFDKICRAVAESRKVSTKVWNQDLNAIAVVCAMDSTKDKATQMMYAKIGSNSSAQKQRLNSEEKQAASIDTSAYAALLGAVKVA